MCGPDRSSATTTGVCPASRPSSRCSLVVRFSLCLIMSPTKQTSFKDAIFNESVKFRDVFTMARLREAWERATKDELGFQAEALSITSFRQFMVNEFQCPQSNAHTVVGWHHEIRSHPVHRSDCCAQVSCRCATECLMLWTLIMMDMLARKNCSPVWPRSVVDT